MHGLTVADLAFAVSSSAYGQEFQVLLILLIMIFTVVFCHSLLRLAMILLRGPRDEVATNRVPSRVGPMGYAQPERPIHVILARDEEIAADGEEREKVRPPPPAYGLWRSSVVSTYCPLQQCNPHSLADSCRRG